MVSGLIGHERIQVVFVLIGKVFESSCRSKIRKVWYFTLRWVNYFSLSSLEIAKLPYVRKAL